MRDDIWLVTSYFNPCRYKTKRVNYDSFVAGLNAIKANLLVVELAFGDESHELEPGDNVIQLRGDSILWQKERLLNIAIARLPETCRKVAWLDCDLLFEDRDWLEKTSEALEDFVVVQPFSTVVRLARGHCQYQGAGEVYESFASIYARFPLASSCGTFEEHGHTGFAWAARREMLEAVGLYDSCLTGSGDHLMAHAFAGSFTSQCLRDTFGSSHRYQAHFQRWAGAVANRVDGRMGFVEGRLLHLWHGEVADRRYHLTNRQFQTFDFDPEKDIRLSGNGMWEWGDAPRTMKAWAEQMFLLRNEDGDMIFRHRGV